MRMLPATMLLAILQAPLPAFALPWTQIAPTGEVRNFPYEWQGQLRCWSADTAGSEYELAWSSADSGRTWKKEESVRESPLARQAVRFGTTDVLFRVRSDLNGHFLTRDEGLGESQVLTAMDSLDYNSNQWMKFVLQKGKSLFVIAKSGILKSDDEGKTWKKTGGCAGSSLEVQNYSCKPTEYGHSPSTNLVSAGDALWIIRDSTLQISLDTGKSWGGFLKGIPNMAGTSQFHAGVPGTRDVAFSDYSGSPLRLMLRNGVIDTVRMAAGWPNDSVGMPASSRSMLVLRDTLWSIALGNLLHWDEQSKRWNPAGRLPNVAWGLEQVQGRVWVGVDPMVVRREDGQFFQAGPLPEAPKDGINAVGWSNGLLFACGWSSCWNSSDSGRAWNMINKGLEGTWVSGFVNSTRGFFAMTGSMGLRRWNGDGWEAAGIPPKNASAFLSGCSKGDTLLFQMPWGEGAWMSRGNAEGWTHFDTTAYGSVACTDDGFWRSRGSWGNDTIMHSNDGGQNWKALMAPFSPRIHQSHGKLVLIEYPGQRVWLGDLSNGHLDSVELGSFNEGQCVAEHPAGALVFSSNALTLFRKEGGKTTIPLGSKGSSWISGLKVVGDRVFIGSGSGLWTAPLSEMVSNGVRSHAARSANVTRIPRGLALHLERSAHVRMDWLDAAGRALGTKEMQATAGSNTLLIPASQRGLVMVRLSVDGKPQGAWKFALP